MGLGPPGEDDRGDNPLGRGASMPSLPFLFILYVLRLTWFWAEMLNLRIGHHAAHRWRPTWKGSICEVSSSRKTWWWQYFFSPPSNYFMNQSKYFLGDLITRYVVLMPVSKPGPLCFTNPLCKCVLEKQRTATHLRRGLVLFPRPVTSWRTASSPVTTGKWKHTQNYSVYKTNG